MYDWAASSVQTTIMVAVFPIYFVKVAGAGIAEGGATQRLATINSIALLVIALVSPLLGAISDYRAAKKRFTAIFLGIGVVACCGLFLVAPVTWISAPGSSSRSWWAWRGATSSTRRCFLTSPRRTRSTGSRPQGTPWGTSAGVCCWPSTWPGSRCRRFGLPSGEGLSESEATLPARLAFLSVAVWWALFSIPLFRRVPEPPVRIEPDERPGESPVRVAFVRLGETFRELRSFRQAFLMLLAFLIYNDGIQTIIKMATAYGTEIGIDQSALIGAILLVQFVGIPCTFLFGTVAGRIGAKRAVFLGLLAYTVISILGYYMTTATHFYILAGLVGVVQGGTQALSRSLFASMIPRAQVGRVLRVLQHLREVRGDLRPADLRGHDRGHGVEPQRDPVGDRILRRGRGAAGAGERGGGTAGGAGGGAGDRLSP